MRKGIGPALTAALLSTGCAGGEPEERAGMLPLLHDGRIARVEAGEVVLEPGGSPAIRMAEMNLKPEQVKRIIDLYNDLAAERHLPLREAGDETGSVKSGVVFRLDNREEVRIQYLSGGDILITAQPPHRTSKFDDPEFAELFEPLMSS